MFKILSRDVAIKILHLEWNKHSTGSVKLFICKTDEIKFQEYIKTKKEKIK